MSEIDYSKDTEFSKLVTRRSDANLTLAALELARDAYPDLDFAPVLDWIGQTADEIRPLLARSASERDTLEIVAHTVAIGHGIAGTSKSFEEAQGSFLNDVIRLKRGLPITLSVLYMAICERLSIELLAVAAPMHFITRLESIEGPIFFDAFSGSRIMSFDETVSWLAELTKLPTHQIESSLEPASTRDIIIRMLTNLRRHYAIRQDWSAEWLVLNRLVALNPTDYETRRDLAFTAGRADHTGAAIRLLKSLLNHCPNDERQAITNELATVEKQLHRWN